VERSDLSWLAVCVVTGIAVLVLLMRSKGRIRRIAAEKRPVGGTSVPPPPAMPKLLAGTKATPPGAAELTARDLREMRADEREEAGECIVDGCRDDATKPRPIPAFVFGRMASLLDLFEPEKETADLPPVWKIVATPEHAPPCLCGTHYAMAVAALGEKIAAEHAKIARFFAEQRESMVEFSAHNLIEHLDDVQARIRHGGSPPEVKP